MSNSFENHPIHTLIKTWHQASLSGDLPTILSLMAEEVVFLTAGNPPMSREDFIKGFTALQPNIQMKVLDWRIDDLIETGGFAYCQSYLHLAITPAADGEAKCRKGPILSVFRKEPDGHWVLVKDANLLTATP